MFRIANITTIDNTIAINQSKLREGSSKLIKLLIGHFGVVLCLCRSEPVFHIFSIMMWRLSEGGSRSKKYGNQNVNAYAHYIHCCSVDWKLPRHSGQVFTGYQNLLTKLFTFTARWTSYKTNFLIGLYSSYTTENRVLANDSLGKLETVH